MNESLLNTHKKNVILTKTLFAIWCILMLMNVIVEEKLINIFLYISCALVVFCVVVPLNKKKKGITFVAYYLQFCVYAQISALLVMNAHTTVFLYLYMALSVSLLYQDKKILLVGITESLVAATVFYFWKHENLFPFNSLADYLFIFFSFAMMGIVLYLSIQQMQQNQNALLEAKKQSEEDKKELAKALADIQKHVSIVQGFSSELQTYVNTTTDQFEQVSYSFKEMNKAFEQESKSLNSINSNAQSLTKETDLVVSSSSKINDKMEHSNTVVITANKQMNELEEYISEINTAFLETEKSTELLQQKMTKVQHRLDAIGNMANSINLIALNASIESAHLQSGNGNGNTFAVISNEIKKLAEHSHESAEDIREIVEEVVEQSGDNYKQVQNAQKSLVIAQDNANKVKTSLNDVTSNFSIIKDEIQHIQARLIQLQKASTTINTELEDINSVSSENVAGLEQLFQNFAQTKQSMDRISNDFEELQNKLK
ncbi:methyl-accepting chemotaxis protein [Bacillus paranthracis]|uniref:methyl-accepting chemotaxis protein n=1 Tax=Bacillus paranthracis TaxID=2026186 RepID=UPI0021515068|nr:methyl-accepting chemotaxis protein [Bacillus paranthracis]MCR6465138.1 methyl-accepting chemotaxis protein [Bacillus paranthracis]MCR9021588.1 methyl-accepting chemotaxis protein [Bacillus paranthracis]